MKKIQTKIASFVVLSSMFALSFAGYAGAAIDPLGDGCKAAGSSSAICSGGSSTGGQAEITNIVNLLLYILGVIAIIMIIVGGIRYATSGGDANQVKAGKDTILYSVIGLVVALLAYAIVNFVLGRF